MPLSPARLKPTTRSILTIWLRCTRKNRLVSSRASTSPIGSGQNNLRSHRRYRCNGHWRGPRPRRRPATKCVPPSRSTGSWRAKRRGGPPAPPSGPLVPRPSSARSGSVNVRSPRGRRCERRLGPGRRRQRRRVRCPRMCSGTRVSRKMPETRKATMATTMASRSVESAGALIGGCPCVYSVKPAIAV